MARKLNPAWELAAQIAREMGNEAVGNIKRLLKEFKEAEAEGIPVEMAIHCWRNLRSDDSVAGFLMQDARLTTVLKGSPSYFERWKQWVLESVPPVWDSSSHDTYVRENCEVLSKVGFVYRAGRISPEELEGLGLRSHSLSGQDEVS